MTVKYETPKPGVAHIMLNRPERLNAFNRQLRADLTAALKRASSDGAVRAVILSGEGRGFCAGADIGALDEDNVEDVLNTEYAGFLSVIQSIPKPVIAAVTGPAAGIGMTLALTCDLRIMGESAYLMSAFANIGLVPDGGLSWLLTQQLGFARAYQLAIEAEKIDAVRALDWGLANRVVPDTDVLENAIAWGESLTHRAPIAMGLTKRVFRAAAQDGLRNAMALEAMNQRMAIATEDCMEGIKALGEKRKPAFKGK
ncbi:enoyl-CoA hydratase/isomerase family protein [Hyphococcus sp.]|uniref:enoyl-CoA hydratase/isomerase family protein n=1 Tax=Hyphococcus sp. TaxID=2038636 RepID=UPI00207F89FC|nr:MAG: 2-(1,2-epoxy-1,2-dihydrophenyl)acetyl-CoA isomerase [Marinicaulis sp.]